MTSLQLSLPSSPPQAKRALALLPALGLVPIELENGCSEEGCSIESDDHILTNAVRRHFLEHFGHRDLEAVVADYAEDAVLVHVINGERKSYHGHEQIRDAFLEIFKLHPTVNSSFLLEAIVIRDKVAMVYSSAKTPRLSFPQRSDTFRFNTNRKISKQVFNCQLTDLEEPWYVDDN